MIVVHFSDLRTSRYVGKKLFVFLISFFAFLMTSSSDANAAEKISASATAGSHIAKLFQNIMKDAYSQMGMDLTVHYFPGKRALSQSSSGKVDSELFRIASVGKRYPNLIMISPSIFDIRGIAYAINDVPGTDLTQYKRIGIVRGVRWASKLTKGHDPIVVENVSQLFQLLKTGRIDVGLSSYISGYVELKKYPKTYENVKQSQPLIRLPLHHYLHKSKKTLVSQLSSIILQMKGKGKIERYIEAFLAETSLN